jgi:hypothetical protein
MAKAANVEIVRRIDIGGAYVTTVVSGDVGSVRAAVEAGPAVAVLRVDPQALAGWLAPAEGQALEDHLYVVDPMGEWMMRMPAAADPSRVKRDLDRVLRASASWDTAGR